MMHVMEAFALSIILSFFGIMTGLFMPGAYVLGKLQAKALTALAKRRILSDHTVKAEYTPPDNLTPVETGYLFDNQFGDREFFAAAFELHDTGHLQIEYRDKMLHYTKTDRDPKALLPYQQLLLEQMHHLPKTGALKPNMVIYYQNLALSHAVKKGLIKKGYYIKTRFSRRRLIGSGVFGIICGTVLGSLLGFILTQSTTKTGIYYSINGMQVDKFPLGGAILFGIMFGAFAAVYSFVQMFIILFAYNRMRGFGSEASPALKEVWVKIVGYKLYLETVEQDNLTYELETEGSIANPELPAALALGLVPLELFIPAE